MNARSPHRLRLPRIVAAIATVALLGGGLFAAGAAPASAATPPRTTISLTFDDGDAGQMSALPVLKSNGMKATFYVVSGYVGADGYFSRSDLNTLKAAGHEIGGHTVNHPDLATLSADEAKRQICTDRSTLTSWGFSVRSFAYPFASSNAAAEKAARDCGYRSARLLGDLASRFGCSGCPYAETIRPANAFATRALDQFDSTWTLDDLKQGVLNAEKAGGWVQYTFHDVCATACSDISITPALLGQFLSWLKPRATTNNTVVSTVGDVVGGTAAPVVAGPVVPAPGPGVNGIVNPGMESVGPDGTPSCWMRGGWGANSPTFSLTTATHGGSTASRIDMAGYSSGDAKLLPQFDLGACSPTVTPGRTYSLRSWYASDTVTQYAVYLRNSAGAWSYWTSSPWFAAAPTFTEATWTTPAIPAGFTGISFALTIFGDGTLRTDDLAMYDTVGAPAAATPPAATARSAPPAAGIEVFGDTESTTGG